MAKNITIYTTNTCGYCSMVKKFLTAKGQTYEEVNLDQDPARQQEALALSGALTVPVTVVTKEEAEEHRSCREAHRNEKEGRRSHARKGAR